MGKNSSRLGVFLLGVIVLYFFDGIVPVSTANKSSVWKASDVRVVDFVDAKEPYLDLIAVYTREHRGLFQLRLDYLDIALGEKQNILIAIDNKPGGNSHILLPGGSSLLADIAWDLLLFVDDNQDLIALDSRFTVLDGIRVRLERDLAMDSVTISINKEIVTDNNNAVNIQAFSLSPDLESVVDSTVAFSSDQVADEHAKVVIFFWNTFQSSTPAEALRAWDGAHAGPRSSRHGLRYLLEAASITRVPIVLRDMASPPNYSALDYLGVLDLVRGLVRDRVVFVNAGWCYFSGSQEFLMDNGYAHFGDNFNTDLAPGAMPTLALPVRHSLVESTRLPKTFVIIGGDFATSEWGMPGVALYGLEYIANHPWIQIMGEVNLLPDDSVTKCCNSHQIVTTEMSRDVYSKLIISPPNPLTETAWQMYHLLEPDDSSEEDKKLAQITRGYIFHMLAAAQWADFPYDKTDCMVDLDQDGNYECILANQQIFTTIELESGTMVFAFFRDETGAHQIVGPTHQFVTSESLLQIPGALSVGEAEGAYRAELLFSGVVELVSGDMSMRKRFEITSSTIDFTVNGAPSIAYIPITVDPWQRFASNWGKNYCASYDISSHNWIWGVNSGISIEINTANPDSFQFFNSSIDSIRQPEDPNRDYTAGHYIPFPMAVIALQPTDGHVSATLRIIP